MKKILVTVFILSFALSIGFVKDGFGKARNFDTSHKEPSINGKEYHHYIRKLDGDVISHFTFVTVMNQDLMDELWMSFRSEFNSDLAGSEEGIIEKEDSWFVPPVDGDTEDVEDSYSISK